ncbi:MAG: diaminopimelate epimerase [Oligoflexia bacterium]|nr:diaminopimelate epimerase [Oligoflexia bacterium]
MLKFVKAQGAENDFIFINQKVGPTKALGLAKTLCHRHKGLGADGLVFWWKKGRGVYEWLFLNSDGSKAEFCGNAARCFFVVAGQESHSRTPMILKTSVGLISGKLVSRNEVKITLPFFPKVRVENKNGTLIMAGVPHLLVGMGQRARAKKLRAQSQKYIRGGANITFVQKTSPKSTFAISFERGVENFTRACGSGAIAAALWLSRERSGNYLVKMPGGKLTVGLDFKNGQATLSGPAHLVFEGKV